MFTHGVRVHVRWRAIVHLNFVLVATVCGPTPLLQAQSVFPDGGKSLFVLRQPVSLGLVFDNKDAGEGLSDCWIVIRHPKQVTHLHLLSTQERGRSPCPYLSPG